MKQYIGTKIIKARPMNRADYNEYRGWELPEDEDGTDQGYLVEYPDSTHANHAAHAGYISWSPEEQFEEAYVEMYGTNTVTIDDVREAIVSEKVMTLSPHDKPVTFVEVQLRNGFTIRETTTCVDPANYSEEIGADICRKKIENTVWMLLGFLLQEGMSERLAPSSDGSVMFEIEIMTFGDAIEAMKEGKKVAREGWNGKDMFLFLSAPEDKEIAADKFWSEHGQQFAKSQGGSAVVAPYILMKTADDKIIPWLASQSGMLADDWMIVE